MNSTADTPEKQVRSLFSQAVLESGKLDAWLAGVWFMRKKWEFEVDAVVGFPGGGCVESLAGLAGW